MSIRYFIKYVFGLLFILAFVSCQQPAGSGTGRGNGGNSGGGGDTTEPSVANWNGRGETFGDAASNKNVAYEILDDVKDVKIPVSPDSGKKIDIRYANINIGDKLVSKEQVQFITQTPTMRSASGEGDDFPELLLPKTGFYRKDHVGAQNFNPPVEISHRAADSSPTPERYNDSHIRTATKMLWVDDDPDNPNSFNNRRATLRAIGKKCYVWIVDNYFTSGANSGAQVNSDTAQALADKFDLIYEPERAIFGKEFWDGITVNIVLFDIEGDYSDGQNVGTFGYFSGKDYSPKTDETGTATDVSNFGKYFYVDSYFAHRAPEAVYSTLAHEFQHMIHWNQKRVLHHGLNPKTWYNEMMSLIAEDMMQSKLGLSNVLSDRFQSFCVGYHRSGITDWLSGNDVLYSYAMATVFGAYLTRNYGGAELVKKISQNGKVDFASLTEATGKSTEDLVKGFVEAVSLPNSRGKTLNKEALRNITYEGYDYPMGAIDLHNVTWRDTAGGEYKGLVFAKYNADARHELRPYGFILHAAVDAVDTESTVNLSFSSRPNKNTKLYVYAYEK